MNGARNPELVRVEHSGCAFWCDLQLKSSEGVVVAFMERVGGASTPPFDSLNVAGHVGDSSETVDENRSKVMEALEIEAYRRRLTTSVQVHGARVAVVSKGQAGAGARASCGTAPIQDADALITCLAGTPLMLAFADCVPIVLVAPGPTVSVVHAGWRGALASLPGRAVHAIRGSGVRSSDTIRAYIGPHIRACHYTVGEPLMSQFVNTFGTFARAESGGLDLDAVVSASLQRAGVIQCNIARLGICTAEATDAFFSYRAEGGLTGRHAAVACIL